MVLFTGLTGTSGSALIERMKSEKYSQHFKVITRNEKELSLLIDNKLSYTPCVGDITDHGFLVESLKDVDIVFHIAAKGYIKEIASAVAEAKTVKHCIIVSSTSIFSAHHSSSQKVIESESYMKDLFLRNNVDYTIIRPTMIYGTLKDGNISVFIKWLDRFRIFPIVGKGSAMLQPVHRTDLANAYYLILNNLELVKGKEYIVSGDRKVSLHELFNLILKSLEKNTVFINVPFGLAKLLVQIAYKCFRVDYREQLLRLNENRAFDCDEIKNELGYKPLPIEQHLSQLIGEYLKKETH